MTLSLHALQFIEHLKQNDTGKALKLLYSDKLSHGHGKILVVREGKPQAVPISELANLLASKSDELTDEKNELCGKETKILIASFICKDIASIKE